MTTVYKLVSHDTDENMLDMQSGTNALISDTATSDTQVSEEVQNGGTEILASEVAGSSESATVSGLSFQPQNFLKSTVHMGRGMLGIFVAILIIVLATMLLNKIKTKNK